MTAIQTVAKPASGNSTDSPRAGLKKRTVESHRQFLYWRARHALSEDLLTY